MDYITDMYTGATVMNFTSLTPPESNLSSLKPTCGDPTFPPDVMLLVFYSIFFALGVFGNGILVLLFLVKKNLRTINNALITNLAFSDFLFVIMLVPIKFYEQYYVLRPLGNTFCFISVIITYSSQDVSTLTMTALSYWRYRAVMRPFRIRQDDQKQLKWFISVCCVVAWCVAVAVALFPAFHCETKSDDCWPLDMHYVNSFSKIEHHFIFHLTRFGFLYLLPLSIIATFYSIMACKLCRAPSFLERNDSVCVTRATRSRKKLGGIFLAIVVIFFLSWLPNYLTWLIGLKNGFPGGLVDLRAVVMLLPATLSPVLLFVISSGYRQSLYELGARIKLSCQCTKGLQKFTPYRRWSRKNVEIFTFREHHNN
ncbi:Bombesin receptor subtype-3 [Holothuria leucospilota]|uniref:Bombesin receptor subtype-3 n=1 Tax=Holothuria leucospilota TaxID=206669 RepID=A0A9Q1CGR7_HOLLE|nr:Bombesin receptor subtype-3 [Holothuria leucospilota]